MKFFLFLLLFLPLPGYSLEVLIIGKQKNFEAVEIRGVEIPRESLKKHLKSGLHNQFFIETIATKESKILFKKTQTWKIYYDLWDEVYRLSTWEDGHILKKSEFKEVDVFFNALERFQIPREEDWPAPEELLDPKVRFGLRMVLNPISPETVARVKKWVHQRRVPNSPSGMISLREGEAPAQSSGASAGTPRFAGLFNEILGHEMSNAQNGAAWKFETILPFSMENKK